MTNIVRGNSNGITTVFTYFICSFNINNILSIWLIGHNSYSITVFIQYFFTICSSIYKIVHNIRRRFISSIS